MSLLSKAQNLRVGSGNYGTNWLQNLPPKVQKQIEDIVRAKRAGNIVASWAAIAEMLVNELHLTVMVETAADRLAALPLKKGS